MRCCSGSCRGTGLVVDGTAHPFFTEHTPRRYARDRSVDLQHIRLDLAFDIPRKKVIGKASITLMPIVDDVASLELDACDMTIALVQLDGVDTRFAYDGKKLRVDFDRALTLDAPVTLAVAYQVVRPKAGIYFIGPTEHDPDKPTEIWTQGQDEDSRYWFPCFDYPNERATSEVVVTVPARFNTLSNGKLLSVEQRGEDRVFHWRHDVPHVAYLVTLVVGEFLEVRGEWNGIPVSYYHHPGDERRAFNSFGQTPKMVQFFSERIGVPYPYVKYSQIPVTDFIFGGMENTTATTQTAHTLHDDRAHLDFSSHPLVSHELAHQWFGNLITCRDWAHGWLNEGFTTYMECCWEQEEHGDAHFQHYMLTQMEEYQDEDANKYRRPIVCNRYDQPIELFDRHLYEKGACVQHMIRFILGERLFWKAIQHYVETNRGRGVVTHDWIRAIEEATGRNLDEFFDQWVFGAGHPEFKIGFKYDASQKLGRLSVQQTQKTDAQTALFKTPVRVAFVARDSAGETDRHERTLKIDAGEHHFNLPLAFEPTYVTFDVGNWILKCLDVSDLPEEMLIQQVRFDTDPVARIHSARQLGRIGSRRALEALGETLASPAPWFVQAEVAKALGAIGSAAALDVLLSNAHTPHPKARRAVVKALGEFRNEARSADVLIQLLGKGDESYFVEAESATSLGKTRDPRTLEVLKETLRVKESFNDVIRVGAIEGLVRCENLAGLPLIEEWCGPKVPIRLRYETLSRIGTLARLGDVPLRHRIRQLLESALREESFFVELGAIAGLRELGEPDSVPALRWKSQSATDGRVRDRARRAADAIADQSAPRQEAKDLRDQLESLRKDHRKLVERLDKLEATTGSSKS